LKNVVRYKKAGGDPRKKLKDLLALEMK